jgi:hypothetical protein
LIQYGLGYDRALGFVPLFDMDSEANIPTFAATLLLLLGAVALLDGLMRVSSPGT